MKRVCSGPRLVRLLTVALALLFVGWRLAEGEERHFSLTALAGIQSELRFGRLVPLPHTADVPEIKVLLEHRQPAFGLSLGYMMNGHLELEGAALYGRSRIIEDVGIGFGGFPLGKANVSDAVLFSLNGCLLLNFKAHGLSPYVGAGVGAAILDTQKIGSKTRLDFLVRAGIRAPLSPRLQAFLELRDSVTGFRFAEDLGMAYPMIYAVDTENAQHTPGLILGLRLIL